MLLLGEREKERKRERGRGFNGSLYAISNGLCFISHSDDFRPCNGAVPYLVYDQWQYISVLSFGTALLHLLVLAVEFSAVQFEQQRLLLQSFVVIFRLFLSLLLWSSLAELQLCWGVSHVTSSHAWKINNAGNCEESREKMQEVVKAWTVLWLRASFASLSVIHFVC